MEQIGNFHDSWILVTGNWFWMLAALLLGLYTGWQWCAWRHEYRKKGKS